MFDNSSNHNAYADNALVVSRMNLKDGGKQPLLRDGKMPDGSPHIITFVDVDEKTNQRVSGEFLKSVDYGCKSWQSNVIYTHIDLANLQCCAAGILGRQPDFESQKNYLQEIIEVAGHVCNFYPKFHEIHH